MLRRLAILLIAIPVLLSFAWAQDVQPNASYVEAKETYEVFVLGDSLAAGLWSGVSRLSESDLRLSVNGRYKEESGLARPEYYDWNGALPKILESNRIDIAIVIIGSNDAQTIRDGQMRHAFGTPEWRAAYIRNVDGLMTSLKEAGAAVYWVELPPMAAAKYEDSIKVISAIHEERAKTAGIRFVKTRPVLADKDGRYTDSGFDDAGEFVRLRSRDGVHFLRAGNNKLASLVMEVISNDIDIAAESAPAGTDNLPVGAGETGPAFGQSAGSGSTILPPKEDSNELAKADPGQIKSDFAGAAPLPVDPAMAQLAKTAKPGSAAAQLFTSGEASASRPGRFDDFIVPK